MHLIPQGHICVKVQNKVLKNFFKKYLMHVTNLTDVWLCELFFNTNYLTSSSLQPEPEMGILVHLVY